MNQYTIENNIPGWMEFNDLALLAITASFVPTEKVFVELGSFVGKSSFTIASNIKDNVRLHCVDRWGYFDAPVMKTTNVHVETAIKNKDWFYAWSKHLEGFTNIDAFQMQTSNYSRPDNVSVAFIDAGHYYKNVLEDISKFDNDPEILLLGDDYIPEVFDGLIKAVYTKKNILNRPLIVFPKSKMWAIWPTVGYWQHLLPTVMLEYFRITSK